MYFELWRLTTPDQACLDKAYLSLFRSVREHIDQEQELMALHCDPNEPDHAEHAVYKQGPHLHLCTSEIPGRHAHIALNRCHLDEVLRSAGTFTEAFRLALVMIREQVLRPLEV
jgi:hypothetical protein